MIGDLFRELAARRTSVEKRHAELVDRVTALADDLDAVSVGDKAPSGRRLAWAGEIAAELRGLVDGAVI